MAERMKLVKLFKEHNVNPLKAMLPLVTQMPIFVSFFFALRKMATLPVSPLVLIYSLHHPFTD
jgi:YidC/Oxa1 family membrane protein insertase